MTGSSGTKAGFDRLVFFSDAVVAIAITLLILPVVDAVSEEDDQTIGHLLRADGSRVLAFLLSFVVIARFWVAHHHLFERLEGYTTATVWVNMVWLLTIVFLPFPTELLGVRGPDEAMVRFVYIGSVLLTSAALFVLEYVTARSPSVWADDADRHAFSLAPGAVTVVALVMALIVGVAVPPIGMWAMLLLLLTGPAAAWLQRRGPGGEVSR